MLSLDYRPVQLGDLVGQPSASLILKQLLTQYKQATDKKKVIPAGMLFKGPRGTGKTTTARIVAMALNCEGEGVEPCLKCSSCLAILDGTKAAVLEMDAASNGLVEDIRKLRESVLYAHDGLYRVVILDEAHAISKDGFNALLKQLEEPSDYVLYILVTTAPEKIIPTVQSRCMHFNFKAISPGDILKRLQMVCEKEQIPYETGALERISRYVDGGMRDALMLLDQLRICGKVTVAGFNELAGAVPDEAIYSLIHAELGKDLAKAVAIRDGMLAGVSPQALLDAMSSFVIRTIDVSAGVEDHSPYPSRLKEQVNKDVLFALLHVLWDVRQVRTGTADAKVTLDLALTMLCERGSLQAIAKTTDATKKLSASEMEAMFS